MKKTLIILFALFTTGSFSQSVFEDADSLRTYLNNRGFLKFDGASQKAYMPLIKRYITDSRLDTYDNLIELTIAGQYQNPYIFHLLDTVSLAANGFTTPTSLSKGLSSLGGIDVTAFADALARFMVNRAKQELTVTFFQKFKEDLDDPRLSDLKILFPATFKTLNAFDKEIYQYAAYLNTLREAFAKDLSQITQNIPNVWKQDKYVEFFKTHPEILKTLAIMNEITAVLKDGKHPGDAIHDIAGKDVRPDSDAGVANYQNSLRLLDLISQSFRTSQKGQYWLASDKLEPLLTDTSLQKVYLGLLVEKDRQFANHIQFRAGATTYSLNTLLTANSNTAAAKRQQIIDYAYGLVDKIETVQQKLRLVKAHKEQKEKTDDQELYDVFDAFINLAEYSFNIEKIDLLRAAMPTFAIPVYFRTSTYIGRLANETYIDVAKKNYNSAIINTALIVDTVLSLLHIEKRTDDLEAWFVNYQISSDSLIHKVASGRESAVFDLIKAAETAKSDKEKRKVFDEFKQLGADIHFDSLKSALTEYLAIKLNNRSEALKKLIKYGTFAANLASAKTAEEAEDAIEGIAMPVGSASVKKHMKGSVSINAYLGGFYGSNDGFKSGNSQTSYGVTGLLGVGYNWGTRGKNPWALSAFVSVLDIGALAAFRVNNDTSEYKFKVKLNQIVSPGAFFIVGFPRAPISFILGYQYAPLISSVTADAYTTQPNKGRLTVGLAVDIPVIHLFNKTR